MPSIVPSASTTTTRIAKTPFLNSAPFFHGLSLPPRYELADCAPREAGQAASAGELLAGLLPLADYLRCEETFERIGRFGIAVRGRARSVMLFSRAPIRMLDGAAIAVTDQTSSSYLLLRLLLEQRYRLAPASYMRGQQPDAARPGSSESRAGDALLLIGDEALRFSRTNTRYPFEVDLAFEWWLWQHLPFVFAVWAIRKDAAGQDKKSIESGLAKALGMNSARLEQLAQDYTSALGIPAGELSAYLSSFLYRLGQPEEEGIARFKQLVNDAHLL